MSSIRSSPYYGPMGFDVGAVIGNLFLNYASHEVRTPDPDQRADFRQYLINTVIDVWHVFVREFQRHVWDHVDTINMPHRLSERLYAARAARLGRAGRVQDDAARDRAGRCRGYSRDRRTCTSAPSRAVWR